MLRVTLGLLVVVSLALFASGAALAAETVKHEGKIVKVEKDRIFFLENQKEMTVTIGADTKVTVDGKAAKLSDLKAGEHAKLECKKEGTAFHALSIVATKA
jgi:hypothetical protein